MSPMHFGIFRLNADDGFFDQLTRMGKKAGKIASGFCFFIAMINAIRIIIVYACVCCECKCFATGAGSEVGV